MPSAASITITTSSDALPVTTRASNPANLRYGPKYPPTLLSIRILVKGEMAVTRVFPDPGNEVVPPKGPDEKQIGFSGLSHFVCELISLKVSQRSNPLPPIQSSFI